LSLRLQDRTVRKRIRAASVALTPLPALPLTIDIITNPWFYVAAVPAVLMLGLSKSGFGSGFGALATPLMALAVPVPQAAAVLLPVLLVIDVIGLKRLWAERDADLLRLLLPAGLLGVAIGTLSFGMLSGKTVVAIVGAMTLLFLAQRLLIPPRVGPAPPRRPLGIALAVTSGFTSFVAHAGGPPISAYVLPLRLSPIRFTATMAVFFAAVNLAKVPPYAWLGLIDARNIATSVLLMSLAPVGVLLGIQLTRRIDPRWFYRIAYTGMFLTGIKLLWDGLR
jgi:uncharacterized membrane protein YfcA